MQVFRVTNYLDATEHFHFARIDLPGGSAPPPHAQDFHELYWVERGRVVHRVNGFRHVQEAGRLTFLRARDHHSLQGPARITNVMVRSEIVDFLGARYPDLAGRTFWSESYDPPIVPLATLQRQRLERAADRLQAGDRSRLSIEAFLLDLHTRILRPPPPLPHGLPDWLRRALRDVHEPRFFRDGAGGLVAAAGRSHGHVARAMQRHLGRTASDYVNEVRMTYAARLLASGDAGITEIAADCGIENLSHFHKLFRARFRQSPGAWRKAHRKTPV